MKRSLWFLMVALFTSCEETIDQSLTTSGSDVLVVEGMLTNESANHVIRLSKPHGQLNAGAVPVTGATVTIIEGDNLVFSLVENPAGSGLYETEKMRAVFGETYTLSIQHNGNTYVAQDSSLPVDALPPLRYEKVGGNDPRYRFITEDTGIGPNYINHLISWKQTTYCVDNAACEGLWVAYNLKNIDVNATLFNPGKEDFFFPPGSVVIRRKYAVSEKYRAFLRSMLSETEWRGGVFDVERGNTATNLSAGATGFFAVTTVVADTTMIN